MLHKLGLRRQLLTIDPGVQAAIEALPGDRYYPDGEENLFGEPKNLRLR